MAMMGRVGGSFPSPSEDNETTVPIASPRWVLWQSPAAPYLAEKRSVWCPGQPGSFPEPRMRNTLSKSLSLRAQQCMATYPAKTMRPLSLRWLPDLSRISRQEILIRTVAQIKLAYLQVVIAAQQAIKSDSKYKDEDKYFLNSSRADMEERSNASQEGETSLLDSPLVHYAR